MRRRDRSAGKRGRWLAERLTWSLLPAFPFMLLLAGWMAYWEIARPPLVTLPPIGRVLEAMRELWMQGQLQENMLASLWRLLLGAGLGIVTGVGGGFIVGLRRDVSQFVSPLVIFFNAISGIVWLPIMIVWIGIGTALSVFVIWNTVFFLVFQNTVLGVQLVPAILEQGVQALGAGRVHTIAHVTLPGALPYVLAGIRSGVAFGWRALIAAELVGASSGLGQMIYGAAEFNRSDIIIGGSIVIGIIAVLMDRWLLAPLEKRTVERWGLVSAEDNLQ